MSLLPGLREIRAPLIAGYIWCGVLWLLLKPVIPSRDDATGAIAVVSDLIGGAPDVLLLGALSVGAYLLGSLTQEVSRPLAHAFSTLHLLDRHAFVEELLRPPPIQPSTRGKFVLEGRAQHLLDNVASLSSGTPGLIDLMRKIWPHEAADPASPLSSMGDPQKLDARRPAIAAMLARSVSAELDLTATRLIGEQSELYSTVDRLRAESELRLAVWLPLVALGVAAAIAGLSLSTAVSLLLATVVMAGLLAAQGLRRERAAGDRLVDAIILGKVEPPTFERIREFAELEKT